MWNYCILNKVEVTEIDVVDEFGQDFCALLHLIDGDAFLHNMFGTLGS